MSGYSRFVKEDSTVTLTEGLCGSVVVNKNRVASEVVEKGRLPSISTVIGGSIAYIEKVSRD